MVGNKIEAEYTKFASKRTREDPRKLKVSAQTNETPAQPEGILMKKYIPPKKQQFSDKIRLSYLQLNMYQKNGISKNDKFRKKIGRLN